MSEPSLHSHLSDPSLTPLITTARSETALSSLTSVTSTALTAYSTTLRLDMGAPRRLLVETPDRLVLTSFLSPRHARAETESCAGAGSESEANGTESDKKQEEESRTEGTGPPMLVALVSARAGDGRAARGAAARLEKVGRELQMEWTADRENPAGTG